MQSPVQQMRDGVMALNGIASIGIDRNARPLHRFRRAACHELGAMNDEIAPLDCVLHRELADLRAIAVPGHAVARDRQPDRPSPRNKASDPKRY